jgi:hypothetical protein
MDPYDDIFDPQVGGGPIIPEHVPSEEEKLYHELIGTYQGTLGESGKTMNNVMWESVNAVLQKLIDRGYSEYSRFMIKPVQLGPRDFVDFGAFRAQVMSTLQRMSQDFNFSDPSYLIFRDMPKSGQQINATATATPIQQNSQINDQTQNQTQNQEVKLTINQRVRLIEQELEEKLTEDQLAEIKPVLEEFKTEPTKWSKASKLIGAVLGLSKDVAVEVVSNIIASQIGIPKI